MFGMYCHFDIDSNCTICVLCLNRDVIIIVSICFILAGFIINRWGSSGW